jgi:formylglycine-generating enzyme required for sulfatase activity
MRFHVRHLVFMTLLLASEGPLHARDPLPAAKSDLAADAKPLNWIGINRRVISAHFISLGDDVVTVKTPDGKEFIIPFNKLSPESLEQAREEARKQADKPISSLLEMAFVPIRSGRFTMGSPQREPGKIVDATPIIRNPEQKVKKELEPERKVKIKQDFWLKKTEVTWAEWNAVRDLAPNYGYTDLSTGRNGYEGTPDGHHPVTEITWWDAIKWCNLKSQIEGKTPAYYISPDFRPINLLKTGIPVPSVNWKASGYRLPTEAEWEYACRDGQSTGTQAFHSGQITNIGVVPLDRALDLVAWYGGNSLSNTHPVAKKNANRFGLHDMHGNVAEWCWDWAGMLLPEDVEDPTGAETGPYRVFRGGSWADPARCCRAAYRGHLSPIAPSSGLIGFRPVCGSDPAKHKNLDR